MRKFQCLLFVLKQSYICYYIICMTVPLNLLSFGKRWDAGGEGTIIGDNSAGHCFLFI